MIENVISKRYAKALSDSISDESELGRALKNLKEFGGAFETDRQLERFFSHPGITEEKKSTQPNVQTHLKKRRRTKKGEP